jgi:hypothetical protein
MFEPVKVGFGEYMTAFYASLVPTTQAMNEYVARGIAKSISWAPGRMIDAAEEMLAAWQRNDTDSTDTKPAKLPAIIVCVDKSYTPTGRDYTRQVANSEWVIIPGDDKERAFGLRAIAGDIRAQVCIFAADEPTARSIAAQFCLFIDAIPNRRFPAKYAFAGIEEEWPVQIESPDSPFMNIRTGSDNVTVLAGDLTLKAEIPLFDAPKEGDPNDGQGVPGTDDPAGYPVVVEVNSTKNYVQ